MSKKRKKQIISIGLLVVGNLIGAGILALPIQTGSAGLMLSCMAMIIFCGAMFFSAMVLTREAIESSADNFNYPSLYHRYLGSTGKWLAILTNMLILYGLLTAYLSGGTAIIINIFNIPDDTRFWEIIILMFLFTGLSSFTMGGTKFIARYNGRLMIMLGITFVFIVVLGVMHIKPERELYVNWHFIPFAIPVILTAFHFHNIIPSICKHLDWDKKAIIRAIIIGMLIGFVMNLIWVAVGIGVLPLFLGKHSIIYAFEHGLPATVPIAKVLQMPVFNIFAASFALIAICTSYIANGMGLIDFNRDLMKNISGKLHKLFVILITFIPPLAISLFFPNIFLKAIGVVGGVGIAILFGVLPAIVCFIKTKSLLLKLLSVFILLLFLFGVCIDLTDDLGIIKSSDVISEIKKEETENYEQENSVPKNVRDTE